MMEYTSKYWNMLTPLIKKSLLKRYGKEETAELLRKTNQIYRDLLRRADDIGKDNPMASNLYEGYRPDENHPGHGHPEPGR